MKVMEMDSERLAGTMIAIQVAIMSLTDLLPEEKREIFAKKMEGLIKQLDESHLAGSIHVTATNDLARQFVKNARNSLTSPPA